MERASNFSTLRAIGNPNLNAGMARAASLSTRFS